VFATREMNRRVGRMVSAFLLFKRFDDYQHEHMLHHSPKKLLTEDDEFADFVLDLCRLEAGMSKAALWRRVLGNCVSPVFHYRFLKRRIEVALFSGDRGHDWMGRAFWGGSIALALLSGTFTLFALAWIFPVAILLQVATIFRILVEHRFPEPEILATRDKVFMCHASIGVFPGRQPPALRASTLSGFLAWTMWWGEMLTAHLFARLFVLVGDAPCHDFHHRRPATRKWTSYIHARQNDLEAGSPGFAQEYLESWGLMNAVDSNLASLAATVPASIGR
jgi:fatty acid desaturase